MHRAHRYVASLFLTAALAAPRSMMAAPVPQGASVPVRVYDSSPTIITTGTTTSATHGECTCRTTNRTSPSTRAPIIRSRGITGIGGTVIGINRR